MVVVAPHHVLEAEPVLAEHRLGGRPPRARDVRHDEEAELVRPVELARHLHLDVHAVAGEREFLGDEDLVLHELVGGERVPPVRMVGLVERELEVDRLVVERHVGIVRAGQLAHAHLAHAEVGVDGVRHALAEEHAAHLVEIGVVEVPKADRLERNLDQRLRLSGRERRDGRFGAVRRLEDELHRERLLRGRAERHLGRHAAGVDVGREVDRVEVRLAAGLEVDGLPDAARVAVALLAVEAPVVARDLGGDVPHAQRELLRLAPLDERRELELERRVAAGMLAELRVAEPAGRVVVARAHDEEHALPLPRGGHRDVAAVPADVRLVLHAGRGRAPAERHEDALREFRVVCGEPLVLHADVRLVGREPPAAVQVLPLGALPVRPRMLRKRDFHWGGGHLARSWDNGRPARCTHKRKRDERCERTGNEFRVHRFFLFTS